MQTNMLFALVLIVLLNKINSSLLLFQRGTREVSILPVALTSNTEAASNGEFLVSFGLSSLKGSSLPASFALKYTQKFINLRSSGVLK